jgi:NTE family protein
MSQPELPSGAGGGRPLALVLSGGGARAAYEVGVLSAIAERVPDLALPILTGVSAGAINATFLAAHRGPFAAAVAALRTRWSELVAERVYRVRPVHAGRAAARVLTHVVPGRYHAPAAMHGLVDLSPLREFLTAHLDFAAIAANLAAGRLRAVALSATSYASGHTVTFVEGHRDAPTWQRARREAVATRLGLDHLMASSALPILFPAVRIGDAFYCDGSLRHTAPLAPAIHLGAAAVLAVTQHTGMPGRGRGRPPAREYPPLAEVLALLFETIFLDALEADVERLERVNRLLALLSTRDSEALEGLRPIQLLLVRPSRDLGELAVGYARRLPALMRWAVRMIGGERETAVDFLSYLLFDRAYTSSLVELGYADGTAAWDRVERLLTALECG